MLTTEPSLAAAELDDARVLEELAGRRDGSDPATRFGGSNPAWPGTVTTSTCPSWKQVARVQPGTKPHIVCDDYATHNH